MRIMNSNLLRNLVAATVLAAPAALRADAPKFVDGDRVAFIGDSITHSGSYHAFVYTYYLTRFPDLRVTFYNCGISGDSAGGANARFDWDILPTRPTAATIMLGMNDVGRDAYGVESPTEELLKRRKATLDWYQQNMIRLIDKLQAQNVRITLITPSPYDQTANVKEKNLFGVNDALAACGQFAKETAQQRGLGLIDFNTQLTALNAEYQKSDPTKTLIGADRVHPGELGHFLMAYYFLKAQGMEPTVASLTIDTAKREVTGQARCTAKAITAAPDGLSFTYAPQSLPFPTSKTYEQADVLVPFTKDLNVERFTLTGLPEGSYELLIDSAALGTFTSADLAAGINIATNPASPMQKQAQAVHAKNMERHSSAQSLRTLAMLEAGMHNAKVDIADPAAVEKHFAKVREEIKGKPWEPYISSQIEAYAKLKPREPEIRKTVEDLQNTLYTLNRPSEHTVTLRRK